MRSYGLASIRRAWRPCKRRSGHRRGERAQKEQHGKTATDTLKKEFSEEIQPAHTLIFKFSPPKLWENKFMTFGTHSVVL